MDYVLDSHVYDYVIDHPLVCADVERLCQAGAVRLLLTHVQEDEFEGVQDEQRRRAFRGFRASASRRRVSF